MLSLVIDLVQPDIKGLIDVRQRCSFEAGEKLRPDRAEVLFKEESYGFLVPVNLAVNCRAKRDRNNNVQIESSKPAKDYKGGSLWGKGDKQ